MTASVISVTVAARPSRLLQWTVNKTCIYYMSQKVFISMLVNNKSQTCNTHSVCKVEILPKEIGL